jgi:hypothetical protein
MNKLNLNISARRAAANEVDNFGLPHAVIDLTIAIDGKVLCSTDEYVGNDVILDGYAVLATLKSTHPRANFASLLTERWDFHSARRHGNRPGFSETQSRGQRPTEG